MPVMLIGMGAVVIDVGSWYATRAQLQNAADSAAMAVAKTCAPGPSCNASAGNRYLNASAHGGMAQQIKVCGSTSSSIAAGSTGLPSCASLGIHENGSACPPAPANGAQYVDVFATPRNTDSSPTVSSLVGLGKQRIAACAQAVIGQRGGGGGVGLTMSFCAWQAATKALLTSTPVYATPAPPYPTHTWPLGYLGSVLNGVPALPNLGGENVVQVAGSDKTCANGPSGQNQPGGFGWLSDSATGAMPPDCSVSTTAGGYVYSSTGGIGGSSSACANKLKSIYAAAQNQQTIPNALNPMYIPVFDMSCDSTGLLEPNKTTRCPTGMPNGSYRIAGYATFILTGIGYSPISEASVITGLHPCAGNAKCILGLFTQGLVSTAGTICTSNCHSYGGPVVVKLNG